MTESIKSTTLSNLPSEANSCVNASIPKAVDSVVCRDRFVGQSERVCSGVDDGLLVEMEALLTRANQDAVRASHPINNFSPLAAKVILRRRNPRESNSQNQIVRTDLARSLAHTLAHLS